MTENPLQGVFNSITGSLSSGDYFVGLTAVCAVIALIKFGNRAASALLNRVGRG